MARNGERARSARRGASSVRPRPTSVLANELDWTGLRELLGLSRREGQVVALVMTGLRQEAIADQLGLGLGTVKTYSQRVYAKLGVGCQLDLALVVMDAQRALDREPR